MGIPAETFERRPKFLMPYQLDASRGAPNLVPSEVVITAKTATASPPESTPARILTPEIAKQ